MGVIEVQIVLFFCCLRVGYTFVFIDVPGTKT